MHVLIYVFAYAVNVHISTAGVVRSVCGTETRPAPLFSRGKLITLTVANQKQAIKEVPGNVGLMACTSVTTDLHSNYAYLWDKYIS